MPASGRFIRRRAVLVLGVAVVLAAVLVSGAAGGASLSVWSQQSGGRPSSKILVQATHGKWPDGSWIESGGLHYPTDIYIVDTSGKYIRNLTHDAPTNYLTGWSSVAKRVVYESVPNDRMCRCLHGAVFSIKADGSGRRRLASGKGELWPQLSPDGQRILFARGRWLYVMRSDGSHKTPLARVSFGFYPLATDSSDYGGYDASWSPDGKRIVFVRGFATNKAYISHSRSALYVVNADGTGLRRLTKLRPKVETMNPAWAPNGRKIAFDQYRHLQWTDRVRSYVMSADGTGRKQLKQLNAVNYAKYWFWLSNDRIAYGCDDGYCRFHSIDADEKGKPQQLPRRVRVGRNVWITSGPQSGSVWPVSRNGKWIAFTPKRPPYPLHSLSIAHLDGTRVRLVTRRICCFVESWQIGWAGNDTWAGITE